MHTPTTPEGCLFAEWMAEDFYHLDLIRPPGQTSTRFTVVNGEMWIEDLSNPFAAEMAMEGISRQIKTQFGLIRMIPLAVALAVAIQAYALGPDNPNCLAKLEACRQLNRAIHEQLDELDDPPDR
jgi:hypothetical protein